MNLYLLKPIDPDTGPWDPWYDKAFGFVVRAASPAEAREIADANAGDENRERGNPNPISPWLDPKLSTCRVLHPDGEAGPILRDLYSA